MSRRIRLTAIVTPDGDHQVAQCFELDVASQGRSVGEALANLREALVLYCEDQPLAELPPPPIIAPVEIERG